ncbi:MAG: DUF4254 domain-containing protein [Leadbetterella sp.]
MKGREINQIFKEAIEDYHIEDNVDAVFPVKYPQDAFKSLLYKKTYIDTIQWHLEDIIRDPNGIPEELIKIKRRIDASNQHRTDVVEEIDEYIQKSVENVQKRPSARLNSETPAWLLDRMSILQLKIYHFKDLLINGDPDEITHKSVSHKVEVLAFQEVHMEQCFDELMEDLQSGNKFMILYKQMKMYNDPNLNPILKGNS